MANTILHKRSSTASSVPTAGQLSLGELALNTTDGKVFMKNGAGSVVEVSYRDARARAAISVTDSGGDGSLSYNSSTGVITYTGPSAADVRAHFTAGTGVTITDGSIAIGQAVGTASSPTFAGLTLTGNQTITGNILPSADNTYDLGSASYMWKDIYVGPGSLYVNGQKVLEESSGNIVVSADANQNLVLQTSGSGDIELDPTGTGTVTIKGTLVIEAGSNITSSDGNAIVFGNQVNVDAISSKTSNTDLSLSANGTGKVYINDNAEVSGNFVVGGNLTVSGTTTTVNSETISLADNIIDLNSNFTTGSPTENAGIRIKRGDESDVQVRWNESSDVWQITNDGSTYTNIVGHDATQTLTNKTINLTNNTLTGTVAQFNTALSDDNFATLTGSETLTNKTLTSPTINAATIGGHMIPNAHETYDLGSETYAFRDLYLSGASIKLGSARITASGSSIVLPAGSGVSGQTGTTVTTASTDTLTNKSLSDSTTYFIDETDGTKKMQFQLSGIATATTRTLTVPNVNGTIITTGDTGTVTATILASDAVTTAKILDANVTAAKLASDAVTTAKILDANVTNAKLANSSVTIGSTSVSLGATATTLAGLTSVTSTGFTGALTGAASSNVLKAGDTMSGNLAMGTNAITGLADPTNAQDAATKNYVDNATSAINALGIAATTGTASTVDLETQTLTIAGTTNEIETSVSGQTITVGLPSSVTVATVTHSTSAVFNGSTSGTVTVQAAATAGTTTITLPATTGTVITTGDTGTVTATILASDAVTTAKILDANVTAAKLASDAVTTAKILDANVTNAKLANSSITINGSAVSLGGSVSNLALTTGKLSQFAATTSAELAGVISDETGSGSLVFSASPTFTGTVNAAAISTSGNVTVGGDLTVNGTTTTINSTTIAVDDKNIILGDVATPTDTTADGGGITLKGATDKTLNWVDATDAWTSSEHLNLASGKAYYINGTSVLSGTTLGSGVTSSSLTSVGTLTGLTVSGAVSFSSSTASTSKTTGALVVTGGLGVGGDLNAGGEITAYASSDERMKENVAVISNAMGKINAVRGVTFDWKDEIIEAKGGEDGFFVRKHDVGVIAQEIEAVLPEIVATRDNGTKAVRYEKLVALLIEAVKELGNKVEQLEAKTTK